MLTSSASGCFVHLDLKSRIEDFDAVRPTDATFIEDRVKVFWGGWSQVCAAIALVRAALADDRPFTHFALISGSDYPLSTPGYLLRYLHTSGKEHINCLPLPAPEVDKHWSRLSKRQLQGGVRQKGGRARLIRISNRLLAKLPDRDVLKCLEGLKPHAGSQWWVLSRSAVEEALKVFDAGGGPIRTFATSVIPDESYFQTVVASRFPADCIARALTFTDWSTVPAPATVDHHHVEQVARSDYRLADAYGTGPCFFVRKVSEDRQEICDRLDAFIKERDLLPLPLAPDLAGAIS
jgi:hypothetical protein